MSGPSTIDWTEATWNPVTGCTKVSSGCDNCYAETFAERWRGIPGHPYEQGFDLRLWPDRLDDPKRWRKGRLIFVNSMSDLFHAQVPYAFVQQVWDTMALTPRHTYQILTKRPDRMERFVHRLAMTFGILENVWLGTSVESQDYARRIGHVLRTPARIRFVSAEPLIGPLDLRSVPYRGDQDYLLDLVEWRYRTPQASLGSGTPMPFGLARLGPLHWVIAGGESGRRARPCETDWLRSLRDQCHAARIPYFLKQLGGRVHKRNGEAAVLDGRLWREMPEAVGV